MTNYTLVRIEGVSLATLLAWHYHRFEPSEIAMPILLLAIAAMNLLSIVLTLKDITSLPSNPDEDKVA